MLALSVSFNAALLSALTYVCKQFPESEILTANGAWVAKATSAMNVNAMQPDAFAARPGAVIEALLPEARPGERRELFDLEAGRCMAEPVLDYNDARGSIAWIRNNGMDISGVILKDGKPVCIGYYLSVVPVNKQLWETITPGDFQGHPDLDRIVDPKRVFIVPVQNGTDTFLFRTAEGTSGILQIQGVTDDRRCVKIRYKLLSAVQSQLAHHRATRTTTAGAPADLSQP